jgi:hypothetical protein
MKIQTLHALRDEIPNVARSDVPAAIDAASPAYESAQAVHRRAENVLRYSPLKIVP